MADDSPRKLKKLIKELERAVSGDPTNLTAKIRLAGAYRDSGLKADAVRLYRDVAAAYVTQGRRAQAVAVCRGILEIEPGQPETQALLATLGSEAVEPPPTIPSRGSMSGAVPIQVPNFGSEPLRGPTPPPPIAPGTMPGPRPQPPAPQAWLSRSQSDEDPPSQRSGGHIWPRSAPEPPRPAQPVQPAQAQMAQIDKMHGFADEVAPADPFEVPTGRESYGGPAQPSDPMPGIGPRSPAPPPLRRSASFDDENTSPHYEPETPPIEMQRPSGMSGTRPGSQTSLPPGALRVEGLVPRVPPMARPLPQQPGDRSDDEPTRLAEDWNESASSQDDARTNPGANDPQQPRPTARVMEAVDIHDVGAFLPGAPPALPLKPKPKVTAPQPIQPRVTAPRMAAVLPPKPLKTPEVPAPVPVPRMVAAPALPQPPQVALPPSAPLDDLSTRPGDPTRTEPDQHPLGRLPSSPGTPLPAPLQPRMTLPGRARLETTPETTLASSPPAIEGRPRRTLTDPRGLTVQDPDADELTQAFEGPFARMGAADEARGLKIVLPLFEELPADAHAELVRRMVIRRVGAGTLIVREGDPGDACYVIATGGVRVLKRTPDGRRLVEVARLTDGALFGEFALLADRRRHASVEALTEVELFEIPRRLLDELAMEYPGMGGTLNKIFRERLLGSLIATAPFFRALPRDERAGLAARFRTRHVEPGEVVIEEGTPGGGLYLVVLGAVEIKKRGASGPLSLAKLGEGSYFGEMSLLKGGTASATVVASESTELAELSPRDFYEVVAAHPTLWEEIRREAARRELATHQILAGDSNIV